MLPFLHIYHFAIPTFGLMLWLAAVGGAFVLHRSFVRAGVQADAVGIVAVATVAGIIGAKLWHVLESPKELLANPSGVLLDTAGFAWFGGLVFAILALWIQGKMARIGGLRVLDLAAPAAAVGYGLGRLGCLTSGDGDYGTPTSLPWGMSFPHGLVPTDQRVHPTPLYELLAGLIMGWYLWRRGANKSLGAGSQTGLYLVLSGIARFLVEFIRINPKILWGMTNAQLASLGSIAAGILLMAIAARHIPEPKDTESADLPLAA